MTEEDTERARYLFSVMSVALGITLSLTIIGAVIGVPLILGGVALLVHTWWTDFDNEEASEEPSLA